MIHSSACHAVAFAHALRAAFTATTSGLLVAISVEAPRGIATEEDQCTSQTINELWICEVGHVINHPYYVIYIYIYIYTPVIPKKLIWGMDYGIVLATLIILNMAISD